MNILFGTLFPIVRRVVSPCDAEGNPITTSEEEAAAHFETNALVLAWFGRFAAFPFGDVRPRMVDQSNPRQYAAGDL